MTKKYLDYLYDSTCYIADIPLEFFETFTPGAANFFDYSQKTIDKYMDKADSIFFTANPIDKAIYFWDLLLENHFKEYSPTGSIRDLVNIDDNNTPIETLIAKFYINCEIPVKDMYIKYAGKWMSPDIILNIPRTIVLLENNTEEDNQDVEIFSRVGYAKEAPSCACIDISMNTRADNSLFEIAYRLRDGQQPVARV
jgi:hypothetical protein